QSRYLAAMRENPLARSYRVDKMTLAALEATLALYRDPARARREIPVLAMLTTPLDELRRRAAHCLATLGAEGIAGEVVDSVATVGAGAFPTTELPSVAIALDGDAERWSAALRGGEPAIVGRVVDGRLQLDMKSIPSATLPTLIDAVVAARD
ncbi:MAG: L-seryl-tRNA(Sec) selenium transferase, partial [Gemmatimonadetes bacterium]|nr:L-seryl-tRNA(Sec) selenium transferase [Gemmatimonadota bacterium]